MSASEVLTVVLVVAVVTVLLTLYSKGKQKQTWKGTLVEKKVDDGSSTGNDLRSIQTYYILIFRTDSGKMVKLNVTKAMFDEYSVGGKFIKKSGANFPELLQ